MSKQVIDYNQMYIFRQFAQTSKQVVDYNNLCSIVNVPICSLIQYVVHEQLCGVLCDGMIVFVNKLKFKDEKY